MKRTGADDGAGRRRPATQDDTSDERGGSRCRLRRSKRESTLSFAVRTGRDPDRGRWPTARPAATASRGCRGSRWSPTPAGRCGSPAGGIRWSWTWPAWRSPRRAGRSASATTCKAAWATPTRSAIEDGKLAGRGRGLARHGRRQGDRRLGPQRLPLAGLDRRGRRGVRVRQGEPEGHGQRPGVRRAGERRPQGDAG